MLEEARSTTHASVPDGVDAISHNMPTLKVGERRIVHYAGWKKHVSLYPAPDDEDLQGELAPYAGDGFSMGYGVLTYPDGRYGHVGGDPGVEVLATRWPDDDVHLVVLCDGEGLALDVRDLVVETARTAGLLR